MVILGVPSERKPLFLGRKANCQLPTNISPDTERVDNMITPEVARQELNTFLEITGIRAKVISDKLGWNYVNFIKFRLGTKDYSPKRSTQLHNCLTEYKQMISQL